MTDRSDHLQQPSAQPLEARSEDDVVDVVVVGAGISGLATAEALHRSGLTVLVLEARNRTGGRLHSLNTDGGTLDLGATWFWDGEERVAALAHRFNIATYPQHRAGDTVVEGPNGVQRYSGNLVDGPAYRYGGGAASLTNALAAHLPTDALRLGRPADGVRYAPATPGYPLEVAAAGTSQRARHVVLAVPPALAAARIDLPDELPANLRQVAAATPVWMGQTVKVVAVYDEPFWRHDGLAGAGASQIGPLQELHDMSGLDGQPAALFGFAHTGHIAQLGTSAEHHIRNQLIRMFGPRAAQPRQLALTTWGTEEWTSPPINPGRPTPSRGEYRFFGHPAYQQPSLGGRLHWASTETSNTYPGHVEGALQAAERTIAAILDHPSPPASRAERHGVAISPLQ